MNPKKPQTSSKSLNSLKTNQKSKNISASGLLVGFWRCQKLSKISRNCQKSHEAPIWYPMERGRRVGGNLKEPQRYLTEPKKRKNLQRGVVIATLPLTNTKVRTESSPNTFYFVYDLNHRELLEVMTTSWIIWIAAHRPLTRLTRQIYFCTLSLLSALILKQD